MYMQKKKKNTTADTEKLISEMNTAQSTPPKKGFSWIALIITAALLYGASQLGDRITKQVPVEPPTEGEGWMFHLKEFCTSFGVHGALGVLAICVAIGVQLAVVQLKLYLKRANLAVKEDALNGKVLEKKRL
jgi:hypothetical protein